MHDGGTKVSCDRSAWGKLSMKHPSSQAFYNHWDKARAGAAAPERHAFEPEPIRHLLADVFVLSYDPANGYPFRVAGTRVCAALGRDVKGESFAGLFTLDSRREIADLAGNVAEESLPAVAGLHATTHDGLSVPLEMLLLPFAFRANAPMSLTGMIVLADHTLGIAGGLRLDSWRYVHAAKKSRGILRRKAAHGFTVYEGLR